MVLFLRSKNSFRYIPENESEQDILGWNTSTPVDPVPYPNPPINISANPPNENTLVPDTTPPTTPVAPVPHTTPPTTSTPTLVYDCHELKWYDSKYEIYLDRLTSLQWDSTNKFGYPVYLEIDLAHRGL